MTREEILEIAKAKYPIGATVGCLSLIADKDIIINHEPLWQTDRQLWFEGKTVNILVYNDGKWANEQENSSRYEIY